MAQYHVKTSEDGKFQGPFSAGQLKELAGQGKLQPQHLVSANGGESWHQADEVAGLEFASSVAEPGIQDTAGVQDPDAPMKPRTTTCPDCDGLVSKRATSCPHCGSPLSSPQGTIPEPQLEKAQEENGDLPKKAPIPAPTVADLLAREVIEVLSGVYENSNITPESRFIEDLGLDEMDYGFLEVLFGEQYGLSATEDDFEDLARVSDLLTLLEEESVRPLENWSVSKEDNPVDDTTTFIFSTMAESAVNEDNEAPVLLLRKDSTVLELFVSWVELLGDEPQVTTRFGKGETQTQEWQLSSDERGTFYPGDVRAFMRELMQVDRLVVQVTPYSSSVITAVFNVGGLQSCIKENSPKRR
jgi:acyl carrier protein